ncbi:MAG: hypothetical protein ACKO96_25615 [Flammeovirgaceae bacterium]
MFRIALTAIATVMAFTFSALAQPRDSLKVKSFEDSLAVAQIDSIFAASDSLSIFSIIDSLLNTPAKLNSSLVVRSGFNSNIVSAGRTIGINQYGATAGASFYHKNGFFGDVTAYWSEAYDPTLYLTIASVGYLKAIGNHYSFMVSYDRLFYNNRDINVENPLTNMISVSNFIDFKPFTFRIDYSYYFGEDMAHRLSPVLVLNLRKYNFIGLDRLSFTPMFQLLYGNSIITSVQLAPGSALQLRRNLPQIQQVDKNVFGLMNYAITAPLRITKKNWSLTTSYTYNWPVALADETPPPNNSFFSVTISKTIDFK